MFGPDSKYPPAHPNDKFRHFPVNDCKESAVKLSMEKSFSLSFINLCTTFSSRLY